MSLFLPQNFPVKKIKATHSNLFLFLFVVIWSLKNISYFFIFSFDHSNLPHWYFSPPLAKVPKHLKHKIVVRILAEKFQLNVEFSSATSVIATQKVRLSASLMQVVSSNINTIALVTLTSDLQTFLCFLQILSRKI